MIDLRYTNMNQAMSHRKQAGIALFITLVAMVVMMLAAVALIRTIDTATVISGNLALKQASASSGDGGVESAMTWLTTTNAANSAKDPFNDTSHALNNDNAVAGYYSNLTAMDWTSTATWASTASASGGTDASLNTMRFIVQRMCRDANVVLSDSNCLFSDVSSDTGSHVSGKQTPVTGGKHPLYRVTVQITGPKNTTSYIQTFIY